MTDRDKTPDTTAPETVNSEQEDGDAQAQTVADEAIARATSVLGEQGESERARGGNDDEGGDAQDLVDHMNQMVTSGKIDMSAFRGERSDDDEEGMYGDGGIEDDTPRGS